jgi:prepilin-type N-terminal cleavage/methylation domain-containing protein
VAKTRTNARGFTVIELVTVVAIIAVLAAVAYGVQRAAQRNASLGRATFELIQRLRGVRAKALTEQRDYVVVFQNSASADALDCSVFGGGDLCARWWVLRADPTWDFGTFAPGTTMGGGAERVEDGVMPQGVHLGTVADFPGFVAPAPFAGVTLADADLTRACAARTCFAIRFRANGVVAPIYADPAVTPAKAGYAFGLTSRLAQDSRAFESRVVLVSFPSGIVKSFTF